MLLFVIQCIGNGETFWQWMAGKSTTGKYWNRENDNLLTAFSFCLSILEQIRLCFKIEKQIFGTWKCDILLYQFFTLQFNYTRTFWYRNLILNSVQYLDSDGVWTEVAHSKSYFSRDKMLLFFKIGEAWDICFLSSWVSIFFLSRSLISCQLMCLN